MPTPTKKNPFARAVRTPQYRVRVVVDKKKYNRKKVKKKQHGNIEK